QEAVDQPEVDDVDAEFRVDDIAQQLLVDTRCRWIPGHRWFTEQVVHRGHGSRFRRSIRRVLATALATSRTLHAPIFNQYTHTNKSRVNDYLPSPISVDQDRNITL